MADFIGGLKDQAKAVEREEAAWKEMPARVAARRHQQAVEYKVDIVRSNILGDKVDHTAVELVCNDRAADGWVLKFCVAAEVQNRAGIGGMPGLMLMFERPGPAA